MAVVVSLLYLAVQIRQSSRIASLNAHQTISQAIAGALASFARDPELYRVWRTVTGSPSEASDDDRERFGMLLHQIFASFEHADRFAQIDPELAQRIATVRERFLRGPAVQEWWSRQRNVFDDPFKSTVDAHLREIGGTTDAKPHSRPAA